MDERRPAVLVSHIAIRGVPVRHERKLRDTDDVLFEPEDISGRWAYAAYGHIHAASTVNGMEHVRYAGSIERLDAELAPTALRQALHVVMEDGDAFEDVGLRLLLAPGIGRLVAGVKQQLRVALAPERGLDGEVVVQEEVPRHEDHRHAVDRPLAARGIDLDRHFGLQAPHTSRRSRTQFSPISLRMRPSFQPRFSIAAVRFG